MGHLDRMTRWAATWGLALLIAPGFWVGDTAAEEFCVSCRGPAASYRCIAAGTRQSQSLKLACITEIAQAGNHESCSIKAGGAPDCSGPIRYVGAEEQPAVEATPEQQSAAPTAIPKEDRALSEAPASKTLTGPIERAVKAAGESVANAGKAINDGSKKTWNCLTSFFKGC